MNDVLLEKLTKDQVLEVSMALKKSWQTAYVGIVNDEYLSTLADDYWVKHLEETMTDETTDCVVATQNNKIVGVTTFGKSITEAYPNDGEIISLYVLPEFMGQRIGHLLFDKAEQEIKKQGFTHCILCTFLENAKAIGFYEAHGYVKVSTHEMVEIGGQEIPYVILRKAV